MSKLPHTDEVTRLLREGKRAEAAKLQTAHVDAEFKRAQEGATINLSDLMAGREAIDIEGKG
jgi:hypothetical protein